MAEGAPRRETETEQDIGRQDTLEAPSEEGEARKAEIVTDVSEDFGEVGEPGEVEVTTRERLDTYVWMLKKCEDELKRLWFHYRRFDNLSQDPKLSPVQRDENRRSAEDLLHDFKRQKVLWETIKEAEDKTLA